MSFLESCPVLVVLGQGRQKVERAGGLGQSGTWMLLGMIGWIMGVQRLARVEEWQQSAGRVG